MNSVDVKRRLEQNGWEVKEQKGSHCQMVHPDLPGKITIPMHGKKDLKPGTLNDILKKAGLK